MTRVIWPMTGNASATAGIAIRAMYPPGSLKKSGSGPEAGSMCRLDENSRIKRTASQNDGVATMMIEMTRMSWSGHLSR